MIEKVDKLIELIKVIRLIKENSSDISFCICFRLFALGFQLYSHSLSDFVFNEDRWGSDPVPKKGSIFSPPANLKKVASPEVKNFIADDTTDIQVGMEVEHQRFGVGKVLFLEGNGADRKALIFFQGIGQKQLLLKFARLKILS